MKFFIDTANLAQIKKEAKRFRYPGWRNNQSIFNGQGRY